MFNLTLSPPQVEFILKPGVTITQVYQVTNNSQQSITLNTQVLPFLPYGDSGSVNYSSLIANPNIVFSLNNANLKLGQPFTLTPQESQQIVLKIKTSPETQLTDYYATLFVYQTTNISDNQQTFSQSTGKIGSHLLLSISDSEFPKTEGQIKKLSTSPIIKDVLFTPINFFGQVYNDTNYFFKSIGKITITKNQKIIKQIDLDSQNVLANHNRSLLCENQTPCQLSPPLWPGKYTATLELDPSMNTPAKSISFFVLPISPIVFITFIIILIYSFRWIKNKFIKDQK